MHRNISVWGQIGIWELATICRPGVPHLPVQLADGVTVLNPRVVSVILCRCHEDHTASLSKDAEIGSSKAPVF